MNSNSASSSLYYRDLCFSSSDKCKKFFFFSPQFLHARESDVLKKKSLKQTEAVRSASSRKILEYIRLF